MKLTDALNLLGITGNDITLDQCKTAYKKACMKFHPDRNPGGTQMMQAVNAAWTYLQGLDWTRPVNNAEGKDASYGDDLMAAINAIIDLEGIEIEVCGAWVWVSGNTKEHKDKIKEAGYKWASKKFMWYFRPTEWKSFNRGKWDMDKIREAHGSSRVARREWPQMDMLEA